MQYKAIGLLALLLQPTALLKKLGDISHTLLELMKPHRLCKTLPS